MLARDSFSKKLRQSRNLSSCNGSKKKIAHVQTDEWDCYSILNEKELIEKNGKIGKEYQDNYIRAVEYVNRWNNLMNNYLAWMKDTSNSPGKGEGCWENLNITIVPNFMAFFMSIIQTAQSHSAGINFPERKTSSTQTKKLSIVEPQEGKRINNVDLTQKENSPKLPDVEEDFSDSENISNMTRNIQESQYLKYPLKQQKQLVAQSLIRSKILPPRDEKKNCLPQNRPAMRSECNIRNTSATNLWKGDCYQSPKCNKTNVINSITNGMNPLPRKHQSIACFPKTPSATIFHNKRPTTGLLSSNGMIASEINAKGTPLIVKSMFEEIQSPVGVFFNKGNILKNISGSGGSSSTSVILSDKDSGEFKIDEIEDDEDNLDGPFLTDIKQDDDELLFEEDEDERGEDIAGEEQMAEPHPLNLNERDLNSKDKNFISSIGIFTEKGELKPDAKSYLEKKEVVRRGRFRAPRISQLHVTQHYHKSYTSGSLSDATSVKSSEIRSDY